MRLLLLACLASCTMTVTRDPGAESSARAMFDQDVAPLLAANCSTCHYVGSDLIPTTYQVIIASSLLNGNFTPDSAGLVTKGLHEGRAWSSTETALIVEWLYAEAAARNP